MKWKTPVQRLSDSLNKILNEVVVSLIKVYQILLSPYIGRSCRFSPTCSAYAVDCFRSFNFFKATFYTLKRLLKCHPLGPHGYDPVPHTEQLKGRS